MTITRAVAVCLVVSVAAVSNAVASSPDPPATISPGTYTGQVRCIGSDHFSNRTRTSHFRSTPRVSVVFGSGGLLKRWTYLFLARHDLAIQSHAVAVGQSFTYVAGAHIGKPGRTRVTIDDVVRASGSVELLGRLDWSSIQAHYIGSGTYALLLEPQGSATIRYEAVKVVVKHSLGSPSKANPVVRRHELCVGQLGQ